MDMIIPRSKEDIDKILRRLIAFYEEQDLLSKSENNLAKGYSEELRFFNDLVKVSYFPSLDDKWCYLILLGQLENKISICHLSDKNGGLSYDQINDFISYKMPLISTKEFAKRHDIEVVTVRQWIRRGQLRAAVRRGGEWLIPKYAMKNSVKEDVTYYLAPGLKAPIVLNWAKEFSDINICRELKITYNKESKDFTIEVLPKTTYRNTSRLLPIVRERVEIDLQENMNITNSYHVIRMVPELADDRPVLYSELKVRR